MAGTVLRNGPANVRRMNPQMESSEIRSWSVIHLPFSRTARRAIPAIPAIAADLLAVAAGQSHRSVLSPSTESKCPSRVASVKSWTRQVAAIQQSFSGIMEPIFASRAFTIP